MLTIAVADPDPDDALIARLGDPAWRAWMHANFREPGAVAELGGADSYARRLRDYAGTEQALVLPGRDGMGFYNAVPLRPRPHPPLQLSRRLRPHLAPDRQWPATRRVGRW